MDDERRWRAELCGALEWLTEEMETRGRGTELRAVLRSVFEEGAPVRQAIAVLGIEEHVLTGHTGPVRGYEPEAGHGYEPGDPFPGVVARAAGEIYRCPDGRCGLNEPRKPGGEIPAGGRCWWRDRPLRIMEA